MSGIVRLRIPGRHSKVPHWRSVRGPLLLLLSAVIPVVLMGGALGYFFTENQKATLDDTISRRAFRYAFALSRNVEQQIQLLSVLSESPRLDQPVQVAEFATMGERLRRTVPGWDMLLLSGPDGDVLVSIPPRGRERSEENVADPASHRMVMRTGKPAVGAIAIDSRGVPAFPIRVPVRRQGRVVSVISAMIGPATLLSVLEANGLPRGWMAWVVDGRGRLVAASTRGPSLLAGPAAKFVRLSADPTPGFMTASLTSGDQLRSSGARVKGTDWTVYAAMPRSEYAYVAQRGFLLMLGVGGMALVLSLAAVFLFLREMRARRRDEEELASWQRLDALGKLTGGIAHDINNLLMIFQSAAESIKRRRHDEAKTNEILEGMKQAVSRGQSLTQRLLQFSRRSNHDAETISVYERSPSLTDMLRQTAQDKVQLVARFEPDLWPVTVDPSALETALINLVTNAREAMPEGGRVTVTARNVPDMSSEGVKLRGPGVAFIVSDEGTGIASDMLKRVFEPFFTTKTDGAPGLGLSQVYSLAVRSGGTVGVASVPGRGSAFTVYLPRGKLVSRGANTAEAAELPKRVLVVDDTSTSLAVTQTALQDHGLHVVAVQSGIAALETLRTQARFQVVLTDIRMPGMTGLQLAEEIGRLYPDVGVALMTGYSEELEAGLDVSWPVLKKPFTEERLLATLKEVLARADANRKIVPLLRK